MNMKKSFHIYARFRTAMLLKCIAIFFLLLLFQTAYAQQDPDPDFMRSAGKIYVVAGVTLIILLALFAYMISIERKISRLEKRHKNE